MSNRNNSIFGSGIPTIHLTDAELITFKQEELLLRLKYYELERKDRGIYASNQDKYVSSLDEFNQWDSKTTEELYQLNKHRLKVD